jgi:N-acetylneuraminic acid mutarotase
LGGAIFQITTKQSADMKANHLVWVWLFLAAAVQTVKSANFTNTGSLNIARVWHTATLLNNGQVLVAGGLNGGGKLSSTELYDPVSGMWILTNAMHVTRVFHTATLLTNGQVLVVGGYNNTSGFLSSVELYYPSNGTWKTTNSMHIPREGHTATLLTNGKILVAGGYYTNTPSGASIALSSAELYDPATGTWTVTGALNTARGGHTATLLLNGQVLIVGGVIASNYLSVPISSAELYDPTNETWMVITNFIEIARYNHTATLLTNGQVLIAGGQGISYPFPINSELYDPASKTWTNNGPMNTAREYHTATLLSNGQVLVAGGDYLTNLSSAEIFDPSNGTWIYTGAMTTPRDYHSATLLTNGLVLIAGGEDNNGNILSSAELYYSTNQTMSPFISAPTMLPSGQFQFSFDTVTGANYAVECSTNLTQWFPLVTLGGIGVPLTLIDPSAAGSQQRFYRIIVSPQ